MSRAYLQFQEILPPDILMRSADQMIDAKSLIPFYEAYDLHSYQCFVVDFLPSSEVSNVYVVDEEPRENGFLDQKRVDENLTFASFLSWLCFYLEDVGYLE